MSKQVDVAVTLGTAADRLPDLVFSKDGDLLIDEETSAKAAVATPPQDK